MGMDLVNERGTTSFTVYVWGKTLALARMYGWTPAGTLPPGDWADEEEGRAWSGDTRNNPNGNMIRSSPSIAREVPGRAAQRVGNPVGAGTSLAL